MTDELPILRAALVARRAHLEGAPITGGAADLMIHVCKRQEQRRRGARATFTAVALVLLGVITALVV